MQTCYIIALAFALTSAVPTETEDSSARSDVLNLTDATSAELMEVTPIPPERTDLPVAHQTGMVNIAAEADLLVNAAQDVPKPPKSEATNSTDSIAGRKLESYSCGFLWLDTCYRHKSYTEDLIITNFNPKDFKLCTYQPDYTGRVDKHDGHEELDFTRYTDCRWTLWGDSKFSHSFVYWYYSTPKAAFRRLDYYSELPVGSVSEKSTTRQCIKPGELVTYSNSVFHYDGKRYINCADFGGEFIDLILANDSKSWTVNA